MEDMLQCYNTGCGKKYSLCGNGPEACTYHPGVPFFHDAYKGWTCCNKKSIDFTEFLNMKGCKKGEHNNAKPPEAQKKSKAETEEETSRVIMQNVPVVAKSIERPSEDIPLTKLPNSVGGSLKTMLEKMSLQDVQIIKDVDDKIKVGTNCQNGGCRKVYEDENCNSSTCTYHPGSPIFHEGMKYWSCCRKKTSDFGSFMSQEGCELGSHAWLKTQAMVAKEAACRYDWHQTGSNVIVSIYAKASDPQLSFVNVNSVKLKIHLVFGLEKTTFDLQMSLFGVIVVNESKVNMLGSKVEITLKKADPSSWKNLSLQPSSSQRS